MSYPAKFIPLANKENLLKEYLGKKKSELPTPCFIVNRKVAASNCKKMLENANSINATFRAHVKTHKTLEGTILQLGKGENKTNKLIVSTLMEAWHLLPLVEQGLANDILFSLPVIESRLNEMKLMIIKYPKLKLRLMLDNYEQLEILSKYSEEHNITKKWSVFVKINMGTNRAGLENEDNVLNKLIQQLATPNSKAAKYISLYGFYCHAGHAYGSKSIHQARSLLIQEVENANLACQKAIEINSSLELVISVGSTPTAHSASTSIAVLEEIEGLGKLYGTLEIHAGNYPFCDLQQVGTNCIGLDSVSCKVLADVLSAYPGRGSKLPGEQLINAGVLAMSRETGPLPGFGNITSPEGYGDWIIGRLSQEHGILIPKNDQCKLIPLGTRVEVVPQHSCITAASYPWYYIFDGDNADDTVVDIWIPFRGW
jgi:D-serine deaminase-like pyridoxal phosphate-dependent protein